MGKPFDIFVAQKIVATFNKVRCSRETARLLKLPRDAVRDAADFLWNRTFHKETVMRSTTLPQMRVTEDLWCEYLYTSGVTVPDAAEALGWTEDELRGRFEGADWDAVPRPRLYARARMTDTQGQQEKDPSEAEIYAQAAELRKNWSPNDPRLPNQPERVEAREYSFRGHDPQVFRPS